MRKLCFSFLFLFSILSSTAQFAPEEIEIIRDQWGVPHIYAPTDAQVSYGLAWAHSEDDFKTIQQTLLAAKQMLGVYLGKEGAPIDYVVGLLRCQDIVDDHIGEISPDFMKLVEGYTAGINAYAKHHPEELLVKKAFPLSVKDVFKAYVLSIAVQDGADRTIRNLFNGVIDTVTFSTNGSNAFAFSRSKTSDEYAYLAVNSHQPLEGPAAWYEAHLVSDEGWNMMGGLFPGGPVVFHGTNEYLGWAHTVNYFDKVDVFQLEMHPEKEDHYRFDDQWLQLEKREIKLKVKIFLGLKIGVKRDAFYSVYGPVVKNDKGVFAFKMAIFDEIRAIEQWYRMNKATNLDEFKKAMSMTAIPSFNTVYADRESNIFYVGNGRIPFRNPDYNWRQTLPGNTSKTLSKKYHPFTDLPQITNPQSGYVFNTNNSPFNATASEDNLQFGDYDATMGYREFDNNRSYRFMELIEQYDQLSWEDFKAIKYDQQLPDSIVYGININPLFRMSTTGSGLQSEIIKLIQQWDRRANVDAIGPAQLDILYRILLDNSISDQPSNEDFLLAANKTHEHLMIHFGKIDVTLGEYQKLIRGESEQPLGGIPDVIAAMNSEPHENGKIKGSSGESYIMLVRYPESGLPIIETVNVFGASNKSNSPHYADQMEMYLNEELKSMTLDIEKVRQEAKSIYSPK